VTRVALYDSTAMVKGLHSAAAATAKKHDPETELADIKEANAARMAQRHEELKSMHASMQGTAVTSGQEENGRDRELAMAVPHRAPWNWEEMDFDDDSQGGLSLQDWQDLDLQAVAVMGAQKFVQQRPILISVWVVGLLIASLAGGLPVDSASQEAYVMMRNHSEAIDSVEITRALQELRRNEVTYGAVRGFWSCNETCVRARDSVNMAKAELVQASNRRDQALSEARREVGIWSPVGVQDVRNSFWSAWSSGKDFAARLSWWDAVFMTVGRDEPFQQVILRMVMKYTLNLTLGLVSCFCYFMYSLYSLIVSYGASFMSGLAFFLLALVAGLSVLSAYLGAMYGVVGTGYMMYMKQAAIKQAIEGGSQTKHAELQDRHAHGRSKVRCPV